MTASLIAALVALVAMFVIATVFDINIGLIAFVSAFVVGALIDGLGTDDLLAMFPVDMFVLIVGVTLLFGVARANRTVEWIAQAAFRMTRGSVATVPWVFFLLSFVITAFGGLPGATVAVVAPLAMASAAQYRINPLLMGLLVTHGSHAGSISPISPIGIIVNGTVDRAGLADISWSVFLNQAVFATAVCVGAYFLFGGRDLIRRRRPAQALAAAASGPRSAPPAGDAPEPGRERDEPDTEPVVMDWYRATTVAGLLLFAVLALGFRFDVGFTAFAVALALTLLRPAIADQAIKLTAWPSVLLITGVLTFVGVMEQVGAIEAVSGVISGLGNPTLAALAVAFIGAMTSLFSTTAGVIGATVPLIVPSLDGASAGQVAGTVSSITISSSMVDTSPVSGLGALLIASLRNRDPKLYFKQLMGWGVAMMLLMPLLTWFVFVVLAV